MHRALPPSTLKRVCRIAIAGLAFVAAACASQPEFEHENYDDASANRLFSEALGHLADNYIDPIDLRGISVAGMNGLTELDPAVRAIPGPGPGYTLAAGDGATTTFQAPIDRDAQSWAGLLAKAVATARARSKTLAEAEPDIVYTAVMNGITSTLDGFSRYEPPRVANESRARREGYGGIGVTIRDVESETLVQEVMPGTPADRAGLQAGDVITHADGVSLMSLKREERAERLRGRIGTFVAVSIRREGVRPFTVDIERAEIIPTTVYFETDKDLPRFRISSFSRNTASALARAIARAERRNGGLPGIVIDLRGNPGGYLTQAVEVADLFLEKGLVVATRGRHPNSNHDYPASPGALAEGKPIILLLDGRSASASELLAAALVDRGRAAAIGSVTYGKGSIQNLEELANGGELIITWSRMHAPSGYLLDGLGVRPTICTTLGGGAATRINESLIQNREVAASWRAYRAPDGRAAERLRQTCPRVESGADDDLAIARRLLRNPRAYEAALSPATQRPSHAVARRAFGRSG